MKQERLKLFAVLASNLFEASSAMEKVGENPGGAELIKHLHKDLKLPHDVEWGDLPGISWSEFKDTRYANWILLKGSKGTGAIKASSTNGNYDALASTGGEIFRDEDDRGGNCLVFLKQHIGKIRGLYGGPVKTTKSYGSINKDKIDVRKSTVRINYGGEGYTSIPTVVFSEPEAGGMRAEGEAIVQGGKVVAVKILSRGDGYNGPIKVDFVGGNPKHKAKSFTIKPSNPVLPYPEKIKGRNEKNKQQAKTISEKELVTKFRSLWFKAGTEAMKDMEGFIIHQIKNGAYAKADARLNRLKNIKTALGAVESQLYSKSKDEKGKKALKFNSQARMEDIPGIFSSAIHNAIILSAGHFYPDETGEIRTGGGYGRRSSSSASYQAQGDTGVKHLLSDIAAGDMEKMKTILGFFKRSLMTS